MASSFAKRRYARGVVASAALAVVALAVASEHSCAESDKQINALMPKDAKTLAEFRRVHGTALRVMVGDKLPEVNTLTLEVGKEADGKTDKTLVLQYSQLIRKGTGERIQTLYAQRQGFDGTVVLWIDPDGLGTFAKGLKLSTTVEAILKSKAAIFAASLSTHAT